jgi:hypothetical protein
MDALRYHLLDLGQQAAHLLRSKLRRLAMARRL